MIKDLLAYIVYFIMSKTEKWSVVGNFPELKTDVGLIIS